MHLKHYVLDISGLSYFKSNIYIAKKTSNWHSYVQNVNIKNTHVYSN